MKKADVKIGGKYFANVSGNRVEIRIDAEKPRGGWDATNLATNKKIVIKTAQRLHGEVTARRGRAKATEEASTPVDDAAIESVTATAPEASSTTAVHKKPREKKAESEEACEKKLSCVNAALQILSASTEPMNAQELITAMTDQGLWSSPGGKTPHATLYSAILRDLAKGDESRFVKTQRGRFAVRA